MTPHVLFVGGVDMELRLPFIVAMRNRGFRVSAASSGPAEPFRRAGIDFYPFHFDRFINPVSDWRAIRELGAMLNDLKPDIAQGYDTKPCLMLPLAARYAGSVQVVRTICGRAWIYSSRSPVALALRPVYLLLHYLASQRTAATVFEIESDRKFFERYHMAGRNGILIPAGGGGVDVEGFEAALATSPSRDELRAALGLGDAEVIITVSRLTKQKGIGTLLKAAAMVHKVRPKARFLLVGPRESEGPLAITQDEIDAHAPYVMALGSRTDVPALLRMADIFAFPTEYAEGVARVLLEAGLARLPVVTTTMPGCCEVIRDGWNGFHVPPGAAEPLAAKILEILDDRAAARKVAERLPELVRLRFSLTAISARHAALYASLLGVPDKEDAMPENAAGNAS